MWKHLPLKQYKEKNKNRYDTRYIHLSIENPEAHLSFNRIQLDHVYRSI